MPLTAEQTAIVKAMEFVVKAKDCAIAEVNYELASDLRELYRKWTICPNCGQGFPADPICDGADP